jgi:peptidyl-prolyl cis-trans isomerase C
MRRAVSTGCALVVSVSLFTGARSRAAMSPEEKARRLVVVATIGGREITTGELEDRIAAVPRFQRSSFGTTPDAVRHKFLEQVIVPEVLYALEAQSQHMDTEFETSGHLMRAHANASWRAIQAEVGPSIKISMDDVRAYYEANKTRYDTPERYQVWRILCKTREEAIAVIDAVKKDPAVPNFTALARDHSIDKATNQRGGNLGFVAMDGTSNEAGLHVDPAIVKAAAQVRDGELVAQPVPEGSAFAVVWHKGTVGAIRRPVEDVAPQIRDTLRKQREELAMKALVAKLRAKDMHELNEDVLNGIEISSVDGTVERRRRPGAERPFNPNQPLPR